MKLASTRKVWWPVPLIQFDADGNELGQKMMALVSVLSSANERDLRQSQYNALEAAQDAMQNALADAAPGAQAVRAVTPDNQQQLADDARRKRLDAIEARLADAERVSRDVVLKHVHSWRHCIDSESGNEIDFTADQLAGFAEFADMRNALAQCVRAATTGARPKN